MELLNHDETSKLSAKYLEKFLLDRWFNANNKDNAIPNSLSSFKVHKGIQTKSLKESQSDAVKQDNTYTSGLSIGGMSLLQVHGFIQHEKVIFTINPSCKHNFINLNLAKKNQVSIKYIQSTQVDGEDVQLFNYLKLTMDKCHGLATFDHRHHLQVIRHFPISPTVA